MTSLRPKKLAQHPTTFAKGGSGHAFRKQAAGPAKAGQTGKQQTAAPGAKRAAGGPPLPGVATSVPAKPGHTGPGQRRR
jgi:hypothetical protein